jgi:hypothetical protein
MVVGRRVKMKEGARARAWMIKERPVLRTRLKMKPLAVGASLRPPLLFHSSLMGVAMLR